MRKEERAFRRLIAETMVDGPDPLTRKEIHQIFGISEHMVKDARRAVKEAEHDSSQPPTSKAISNALKRKRKTSKFFEKREAIRKFYEENSTPTSRQRDVVRIKVSQKLHEVQISVPLFKAIQMVNTQYEICFLKIVTTR